MEEGACVVGAVPLGGLGGAWTTEGSTAGPGPADGPVVSRGPAAAWPLPLCGDRRSARAGWARCRW